MHWKVNMNLKHSVNLHLIINTVLQYVVITCIVLTYAENLLYSEDGAGQMGSWLTQMEFLFGTKCYSTVKRW